MPRKHCDEHQEASASAPRRSVRDCERELRLMMDGTPALIEYVGPDGRYRRVNQAHERWFGLTPAEIEGMHIRDLLGEAGWAEVRPYVERVLRGETVTLDRVGKAQGDETRWVRTTLTPDRDEEGRVCGFVAHAVDIGDRKRADLEREITVEFLRMVNESTGTRVLAEAAISFLQERSGCEAVGIRLREGDDYPYLEARGFPRELVRLEVSLHTAGADGVPARDADGKPILEGL